MTKEEKLSKLGNFCILNAQVLLDENLTDFEKLLYSLINSLATGQGYAWASDEYLSEIFNKSTRTISRSLSKLEELGYIKRETLSLGLLKGSQRKIYTQETLNIKGFGLAKNGESRVDKNDDSRVDKNGECRVDKNGDSLIEKGIKNNNKEPICKIEKIKEEIIHYALPKGYKLYKLTLELSKLKTEKEVKAYFDRILNGELKY